ncbi:hypothetical protein [Echinicola rosea]|uniref:Uncharacterized protein n=1 Tax=Echinicola rosea TaxID=1807691 RepID=A0ABQ1VB61_9BACT|nr:hypothetical protein [Echinicola rosea]GGF50903.1 hypothetical protein GCM10011339_44300 [Echinicola rosea]
MMRKLNNDASNVLNEYYQKLGSAIKKKLNFQKERTIETNKGEYELIKIEDISFKELNIENIKFHLLFSPNGCEISGKITMKASAYPPGSDKNGFTSYFFEINFNSTKVKFDFEEEDFRVVSNMDINYITVHNGIHY